MKSVCRVALLATVAVVVAAPSFAEAAQATQPPAAQQPPAAPQPTPKPTEPEPKDPTYEETVVVTGSRAEQKLADSPATMTVIGAREIETAASQNFADLL